MKLQLCGWGFAWADCWVQSTYGGFGLVNQENVFKVCDQPHPLLVSTIIGNCIKLKIDEAYEGMKVKTCRFPGWVCQRKPSRAIKRWARTSVC